MSQFDFTEKHILQNEHVLLRPLEADDYINLKYFALKEPDIWKFAIVPVAGEENMKKYIANAIQGRNQNKEYPFIVYDKVSKQYAGCTRLYEINLKNKTLMLGYTWYGKNFQGTPVNKNCKFLLLQFVFETMGMERVEFRADNNNKRSIAAMKSIGCTEEGVLRQDIPLPDGTRRDSIVLSILKNEWLKVIKPTLAEKINTFL